jgi:hypothetical protein
MDYILASESGRNTGPLKTASFQMKTFLLAMDMTQPILEDLFYVSIVEQSQSDMPTETLESRVKYLSTMVEMLFTYLPGINRLRMSRCLALERKEREQSADPPVIHLLHEAVGPHHGTGSQDLVSTESVATQKQTNSNADALIEANYAKVQHLERLFESRDSIDKTYAGLLTKERQKLEDWRFDRDKQKLNTHGSEDEIVKMQEQLQSKLQPLLEKSKQIDLKS